VPDIAFTNCRLLDPRGPSVRSNIEVLVRGNRIREVAAARLDAPDVDRISYRT
jgi:hypothetical protein